jgi:hypothetical protein
MAHPLETKTEMILLHQVKTCTYGIMEEEGIDRGCF